MESITNIPHVEPSEADVQTQARAREIRSRLPGQVLVERIEAARLAYGALYGLEEIRRRVEATLSRRFGTSRHAQFESIEMYGQRVPDEVLLKYDDANNSGLFSEFSVVSPTYRRDVQADPWLVGHITGTDLYAIIAQWM